MIQDCRLWLVFARPHHRQVECTNAVTHLNEFLLLNSNLYKASHVWQLAIFERFHVCWPKRQCKQLVLFNRLSLDAKEASGISSGLPPPEKKKDRTTKFKPQHHKLFLLNTPIPACPASLRRQQLTVACQEITNVHAAGCS